MQGLGNPPGVDKQQTMIKALRNYISNITHHDLSL